jgi:iron complex transport system substrate-binding protein
MPHSRIASLISSATEILFALGLEDSIVAVSHECDYPAGALAKPRVTWSHVDSSASSGTIDAQVKQLASAASALYAIDVEHLAALAPDLIVTQAQCDVCAVRYADVLDAVASRAELRGTQVLALNPQSLADVLADVGAIGLATGRQMQAARFQAELQSRIAAVRSATAELAARRLPRVALIEWIEPLMLSGNWMPEMVELAGGRHELTQARQHSPYVDWHDLAAYDPQVVLVMPCGFDLARTLVEAQSLTGRPEWHALAAVRSGRAFAVDGNAYFNRSGPRLVDSLELLGHVLHPELVPAPAGVVAEQSWRRLG